VRPFAAPDCGVAFASCPANAIADAATAVTATTRAIANAKRRRLFISRAFCLISRDVQGDWADLNVTSSSSPRASLEYYAEAAEAVLNRVSLPYPVG
jgi:hypothetical protein